MEDPRSTDDLLHREAPSQCGAGAHGGFGDRLPCREGHGLILSRTRLDLSEAPKGKKLEAVKQLMMRVHRAAGHPGFSKLQDLLRARGSPSWAVELGGALECPERKEAAKPRLVPPASLGKEPELFEILGSDVFELEDGDFKHCGFGEIVPVDFA